MSKHSCLVPFPPSFFFCLSSFPVQHTHTQHTHTHTQHTTHTHTHTYTVGAKVLDPLPHPSAYRRALFGVGGCSIENIKYINRQYDLAWSDSVEAETGIESKKIFNALSTSKTNLCVDCSFLKNSLNGVSSVPDRYQQAVSERGGKPKKGFYSPGLIDYFISKNRNHVPRVQKQILFDSKEERISKLKQAKEASKDMPLDQRRVMKCHKDETAKVTPKMSWSSLRIDSNLAKYRKIHDMGIESGKVREQCLLNGTAYRKLLDRADSKSYKQTARSFLTLLYVPVCV